MPRASRQLGNVINVSHYGLQRQGTSLRLPFSDEEAVGEYDADYPVAGGKGADHPITQVPVRGDQRSAVRVAGEEGSAKPAERLPEALLGEVAHTQDHPQPLHLAEE